jgi:predicted flap endonuclease-1-like 5' DNA nuclease
MSLLYAVVFASRCRSNHHRLAVDALRHLRGPRAQAWRDLFLTQHVEYLRGAKAPDDEFKDFKNHVLHVREKEWGGAIEACNEWYRRTVRALAAKDWAQAAWSAGVLSHYFCDPHQPFHTHQTEEENVIHRAVEWSFSKSYVTFQNIIESDLGGYPDVEVPAGEKWLADMVRAGAKAANAHYETVIEHYDFARGVKDPPAGLDQELKDTIARLVGLAAVGFARVLDRAVEEAAVKPPRVDTSLQTFFLALDMPIQGVLKLMDNAAARREVEAQYEEYRRSGKVRATLGEDDKVVRELHAAEVLKTPLSSIDAKWPREIGAKAGEGAPPRTTKAKARVPQARQNKTIDIAPIKPEKAAPKPVAPLPTPAPSKPASRELPAGAPLARKDKVLPRPTLSETAPVVQAPSIGPKTAKRLEAVGVKTIADLLALNADEGEQKIDARHISAQIIRDWQAQAALACTVPGLRSREAQALVACDVRDVNDLAQQDALTLCDGIARWGLSEEGQRAWGNAPAPTEDDVATWIERARRSIRERAANAA